VVSDGVNPPTECSTLITIQDTVSPIVSDAVANPNVLWPPNNKVVEVQVDAIVEDACSSATWEVFAIECDDPHDSSDIEFVDDHTVSLRATRSGKGGGRIYTLWLRATDQAGNECDPVSVEVTVPHDQGKRMR
jgi:hypothetical protein